MLRASPLSTLRYALLVLGLLIVQAQAHATEEPAMLLHILDYIRVDYPGTVNGGKIVKDGEYGEMVEFSGQARELTGRLGNSASKARLMQEGEQLKQAIEQRLAPEKINALVEAMSTSIAANYPVTTAPRRAPDLATGKTLFQRECASCHGDSGDGKGPHAARLSPPPINFLDTARQRERSVWGLYSAITQGVEGTAMRPFAELDEGQRWALAFYVANFPFSDQQREAGHRLWQSAPSAGEWIPDLAALSRLTPAAVEQRHGREGVELLAYLRSAPQTVSTGRGALATAQQMLANSLDAYRHGNPKQAYKQALSAYLDGFEPSESSLRNIAPGITREIEHDMLAHRESIRAGAPLQEIESQHDKLRVMLERAADTLDESHMSASAGFLSAFVILLREGLEAILLLAAVTSVLLRSGRRDALPYLHAGWLAALGLGGATWAFSTYLFSISGAGRELTEGLTALLACAVLLYVGFWLHDKTHTSRWRAFIDGTIHSALQGRSLWFLSFIAFLAVYREVFETVLFYQALWLQADSGDSPFLWGGIATATLSLVAIGWLLLRTSVRLPLKLFFRLNAAVLFVLAVAFAGHGIAGLQEAGWLSIDLIRFPSVDLLGIYPTLETLAAQLVVILLVGFIVLRGRTPGRNEAGRHA